jgi:hypothetical protein
LLLREVQVAVVDILLLQLVVVVVQVDSEQHQGLQ